MRKTMKEGKKKRRTLSRSGVKSGEGKGVRSDEEKEGARRAGTWGGKSWSKSKDARGEEEDYQDSSELMSEGVGYNSRRKRRDGSRRRD
jgi:hypothetical protein